MEDGRLLEGKGQAPMRNKIIFALVVARRAGAPRQRVRLRACRASPCRRSSTRRPTPTRTGIYANGIVESYQSNGENINIYPEVAGLGRARSSSPRGSRSRKGRRSCRSTTRCSARPSSSSSPRPTPRRHCSTSSARSRARRTCEVARAQVEMAEASLKTAEDHARQAAALVQARAASRSARMRSTTRSTRRRSPRPISTS